jgi:hypothetical protein
MKLYVPEIGDHLRLTSDWTFNLHEEYRNKSLWDLYDCDNDPEVAAQKAESEDVLQEMNAIRDKWRWPGSFNWHYNNNVPRDPADVERLEVLTGRFNEIRDSASIVTIPAGSVLSIDRIFIRKGMDDWSSLTFYLKEHPDHIFKKKPRFWAKLADCNNIEFDQVKA